MKSDTKGTSYGVELRSTSKNMTLNASALVKYNTQQGTSTLVKGEPVTFSADVCVLYGVRWNY